MTRHRIVRTTAAASAILAAIALGSRTGEAHKPITSKYTYNDDVFPILQQRCARCHVAGGVAPMSLMTYEEAFPWAESMRAELVAAHMPPATADESFGSIKKAHTLTPREIDVILTWASGGNPRGALDKQLPKVTLENDWTLGKPDLAIPLSSEFTLGADKMEDTQEFTVATGLKDARWVRAIDVLPGTPAIVRSATITLKGDPDRVLARWLPGGDLVASDDGAAFHLNAGAELVARIRYKKTWSYEGKPMTDRSTIGLYFAKSEARELVTVPIVAASVPDGKNQTFTVTQTLERDVQAYALSPDQVPDDMRLQVEAIRPDGSRAPLVRFNTRADWKRRFWFDKPIALPRGTQIRIVGNTEDPELIAAAFGGPAGAPDAARSKSIRLTLDVVPAGAKPSAP